MLNDELLERLRQVMAQEGNPTATAAKWGIDGSSLAKQLRGERGVSVTTLQAVLKARPDVDAQWLLMGATPAHDRGGRAGGDGTARHGGAAPAGCVRSGGIPLLPLSAIAGLPGDDWLPGVTADDCERYDIPGLEGRGAELLIRVSGVSMLPTLDDGDVMAVRRLRDRGALSWGRMYVIDSDEGCLVKRILPSGQKDTILCHSDNPHYAEFTLPHTSIRSLWDVVGLVHGV